MKTRLLLTASIIGLLALLWVWQCSGPDPTVTDVQIIEPTEADAPYQVVATIRNTNSQDGSLTVVFQMVDRQTGQIFQTTRTVEVSGREEIVAIAELHAPQSSYKVEVQAHYPPR